MKKFLNRSISTFLAMCIIVLLAIMAGGAILTYQYWAIQREEVGEIKIGAAERNGFVIKESSIATLSTDKDVYFSSNFEKMAYINTKVIENKKKYSVVLINGEEGRPYDEVRSITFSPDGKILAYLALENEEYFVVVNGKEGKKYPFIDRLPAPSNFSDNKIEFSPDGKKIIFKGTDSLTEKSSLVIQKEDFSFEEYKGCDNPSFSPDGKQFSYICSEGEYFNNLETGETTDTLTQYIVLNGKKEKTFKRIGLLFSPDSKKILYYGLDKDKNNFIILRKEDGSESKYNFGDIHYMGPVVFSPDSQNFAFRSYRKLLDDEVEIFIALIDKNGKKQEIGKNYGNVSDPKFSPNNKISYAGYKDQKCVFVIDGIENEYGDSKGMTCSTSSIFFSGDERKFAYNIDGKLNRGENFVVFEGKKDIGYGYIEKIIFSPNNELISYVSSNYSNEKKVVIINGKKINEYDQIILDSFKFTDNSHLSYIARNDGKVLQITVDIK